MSFCPKCGAATTPGMGFCTACGEMLPTVPTAPASSVPGALPGVAADGRPAGKKVHPGLALLWTILTVVMVYPIWFWWRTSREVDRFAGGSAHPLARIGALALVAGLAIALSLSLDITAGAGASPSFDDVLAAQRAHPWQPFALGATALGALLLAAAVQKMHAQVRAEEVRRAHPRPLNPAIAPVFLALWGVAPFVAHFLAEGSPPASFIALVALMGLVGHAAVVSLTQARLNALWRGASAP